MKIKLIYFLITIPIFGFTQNFPVTLGELNTLNFGQVYEMPNENILVNNYMNNFNDSSVYSKFRIIMPNGNEFSENKFDHIISDVLVYSSDSIYLLYNIFNEVGNNYLYIELVNSSFCLKSKDSIPISKERSFSTKLIKYKESILFYGSHYTNSLHDQVLTIGHINKEGSFSEDVRSLDRNHSGVNDILINEQNEILLFYEYNYILKLDSGYNTISNHKFRDDNFLIDYNSFWTSKNTFITGGTSSHYELVVKETDQNFNEINSITFESNYNSNRAGYFSNVVKTDSFFYFIGTKNIESLIHYLSPEDSYIFIVCLDYDFNIIWEKEFGGDAFYVVNSVCSTTSNECIILANRDNSGIYSEANELYLLKINSCGDIVTSTPVYKTENKATVYPNPGTNQFNIKLAKYSQPSTISLYNISGTKVLSQTLNSQQTQINTSHLPKGIYIYEINNKSQRIQGKWIKQ